MFREVNNDLFDSEDNLVHCVSKDLNTGAGITVKFKEKFGYAENLRELNQPVGDMCIKIKFEIYLLFDN